MTSNLGANSVIADLRIAMLEDIEYDTTCRDEPVCDDPLLV